MLEETKFIIVFDKKLGTVSVNGPIGDEMFSLWVLESAKEVVKDFNKTKELIT